VRRLLLVGLLIFALFAAFVAVFVRHDVQGRIGSEIRYDDFDFKLCAAQTATDLAGGTVRPQGVFRILTLQVTNHAKRVDYDTASHRPVLVDRGGRRYDVDPAVQAALAAEKGLATRPPILHPGEAWRSEIVFDVPPQADVELRISWGRGSRLLDFLDWAIMGKRTFRLE